MSELARHRHEALGFELRAPVGWSLCDESERGLVLAGPGREGASDARAVVMVEPVEPGADLAAVTTRVLSSQARAAGTPVRLVDRLPDRVGPVAAERVVLHREVQGRGVTVEEWRLLADERLLTVSAQCPTPAYDRHADDFALLARSLRVAGGQSSRDADGPLFDPELALLIVTDAGFDTLRALAVDRRHEADPEQLEELTLAGAVVEGRPHPDLGPALAPATAPLLALGLTRAYGTVRAWADAGGASLLVPVGTRGWRRLAHGPPELLPDALAGLVGLRPSGAPPSREPVTLPASALAWMLASDRDGPPGSAPSVEVTDQARAALGGLRDHWRIDAHRAAAGSGEMLEVLETGHGLWLAVGQGESVELRPTDAATVWRHLTQLTPGLG